VKRAFALSCLALACGGGAKVAAPPEAPPAPPAQPAAAAPEPDPWAGRTDLLQAPPAAKPAAVNLPPIERFTLPNGLPVMVVPSRDVPIVTLHLAVGAGNGDEARGKRALADYAAEMLTKGTARRNAEQIAEAMDAIGGSLTASADLEATHITCTVLSKDLGSCLDLLPEVVAAPAFPQDEMKRVADNLVATLRQVRDQPDALAREHLANLLWGDDHVRGFPVTVEGVQAISRKDLLAWHQARFVPGNALLAVAGDVDPARIKADLGRAFGGWKKRKAPARQAPPEPKLQGMKVRLVDNPALTQSTILVGHLGVAHGDPDYLPVAIMSYTLGGGPASRLREVVRVKGGKSYAASSSFERFRARGQFIAATATRNPETAGTLQLVLGELRRMQAEGPTTTELALAKAYLAGSYPTQLQSAAEVARTVLLAELHGLGPDFVRDFPLKVDAVTPEAAGAAARSRLDPENVAVVIVGKGDDVAPQLEKAGLAFERVAYLEPISPRDRAKQDVAAAIDPARTAAGKKLLDAALAAKGGAAKLRGLKDLVSRGTVKLAIAGRSVEGDWARALAPPDRMYVVLSMRELGRIKMVIGPEAVFQSVNDAQARDLPAEIAAEARAGLWRDHDLILLRHLEPGTQVQDAGKTSVASKAYDTVILRRPDGSDETRVLLDPRTKLIFRLLYTERGAPGLEEYSDYRPVDGIMLPFQQHAEGAQETFDVTVTEHKVNGGVPAGAWEKPKS
jgi:zinc protease